MTSGKAEVAVNRLHMSFGLNPLTPGVYTVSWSAVADDGHRTQGALHVHGEVTVDPRAIAQIAGGGSARACYFSSGHRGRCRMATRCGLQGRERLRRSVGVDRSKRRSRRRPAPSKSWPPHEVRELLPIYEAGSV